MKTSDLIGKPLDWAVAKCEGVDEFDFKNQYARAGYRYSTDWAQGGPIIEREFIELLTTNRSNCEVWEAIGRGFGEDSPIAHGPTPLIAAMRCFVASNLGDTVDIPEELS